MVEEGEDEAAEAVNMEEEEAMVEAVEEGEVVDVIHTKCNMVTVQTQCQRQRYIVEKST